MFESKPKLCLISPLCYIFRLILFHLFAIKSKVTAKTSLNQLDPTKENVTVWVHIVLGMNIHQVTYDSSSYFPPDE